MLPHISIVTVTYDTYFFIRLLVEKVREFVGPREYEIIVVDRGSTDGSREWLSIQPDVRVYTVEQSDDARHHHGEAAEEGVRHAKYDRIVLLDSDAHPVDHIWLHATIDRLDGYYRLAGAERVKQLTDGSSVRYIHPHFLAFLKEDFQTHVILRHEYDTGRDATERILRAGLGVIGYPIEVSTRFSVGIPGIPTVSAGVFHAWYTTRLGKHSAPLAQEKRGRLSYETYVKPLQALLRQTYRLNY
jgi:hypothetical protein